MDLVDLAAEYTSVSKSRFDPLKAGAVAGKANWNNRRAHRFANKAGKARRASIKQGQEARMMTDPAYAKRIRTDKWQAAQRAADDAAAGRPEPGQIKQWFD